MPRFVILRHDCPESRPRPSHWDFMLESSGRLRTWALDQLPSRQAAITAHAEPLGDHRIDYLDYEGPLSGGRGTVRQVASGTFDEIAEADDSLQIRLAGDRLRGIVWMHRQSADSQSWLFDWTPDDSASE